MNKRIKKKLIRNSVCPACKHHVGISYYDLSTNKCNTIVCTNCFNDSSIVDKDVFITYQYEFKKNWLEAADQPLSPTIKQLMKNVGVSLEEIEALEVDD